MTYQFIKQVPQEEYDAFLHNHPLSHPFQEMAWAKVKKEWKPLYVGVKENNTLCAVSLVLIRPLPFNFSLFYLPRGPILDYKNKALIDFFFSNLKKIAKQYNAISIKFDPNILYTTYSFKDKNETNHTYHTDVIETLKSLNYKYAGLTKNMHATIQPRFQAALYYNPEWNNQIPNKVKKAINKAINKGVEIEHIQVDKLELFSSIMGYTEHRKNVSLRNKDYYERLLTAYPDDFFCIITKLNQKQMLENTIKAIKKIEDDIQEKNIVAQSRLTKLNEQISSLTKEKNRLIDNIESDGDIVYLSCLLCIKNNQIAEFLYAGLNERYKFYNAPYYAYNEAIKWSNSHKCIKSNFGGIEGTINDGLSEFKGYFEGNIEEYIGEFDVVVNPFVYPIFTKGLPYMKKILKKLKGRK